MAQCTRYVFSLTFEVMLARDAGRIGRPSSERPTETESVSVHFVLVVTRQPFAKVGGDAWRGFYTGKVYSVLSSCAEVLDRCSFKLGVVWHQDDRFGSVSERKDATVQGQITFSSMSLRTYVRPSCRSNQTSRKWRLRLTTLVSQEDSFENKTIRRLV